MPQLTIILGTKNLSSWSLRPWLVLRHIGVPFREVVIALDQPETAEQIREHTSAGKVPVLIDGDLTVWDSLAIVEYLAERFPDAGIWPEDSAERAEARAVVAEMHSSFGALRSQMPMAFRDSLPGIAPDRALAADIDRVLEIWISLRERFQSKGPFLFGDFSAADAFYAPVVSRLRSYSVRVEGPAADYARTIWHMPAMQEWLQAAKLED